MCGISGIISVKPERAEIIEDINRALTHRGPDGEGYRSFESGKIWFGHRRLSIIDLSDNARQPMCYDNRYWITFNGELYNYIELRNELIATGKHFISESDTEVVLAAYAVWGPDCLNRFNGMWAFVIYDTHRSELFFARDRFGVKPLHYYNRNGLFVFASEIKAILRHPDVVTSPNLEYCRDYLRNGPREYLQQTAFQNIMRFPHACYALIKSEAIVNEDLKPVRYWQLTPNTNKEKFNPEKAEQYATKYHELLRDAVRLRLRSDVKVGSALSGGLDSSSIVRFTNELLLKDQGTTEKQQTFSVVYPGPNESDCDESSYINLLVKELNVTTHQITPIVKEIPSQCYDNIYAMDNPPESSCMSAWHTFRLVADSQDVIVTLDGQGADEQLAGYLKYVAGYVAEIGPFNWPELASCWRVPGSKKYVIYGIALWAARRIIPKFAWRWLTRNSNTSRQSALEPLNAILCLDTQSVLVNLLHFADRTSMAFSIESRMPFMDYRMTELLASIPFNYKIHSGWTKYIARLAMRRQLPDTIVWRKDKMGWPIPEDYWFRGPHKEWFCGTVEKSEFLRTLGVGGDIRKKIDGTEPIRKLIRLLNLAIWHEIFFDERHLLASRRLPSRLSRMSPEMLV
jgi:asparagine synthase (glutamine-hydrolysing)